MTHGALRLPEQVKTYPTLNAAFLRGAPAVGGTWYLYRAADLQTFGGRGWLAIAAIRELQEPYRTWRSVRQLHSKGQEMGLWVIDGGERLRIHSLAKAAAALACGRLEGRPVYLPIEALTAGVQSIRAHFYASFEEGRVGETPLSRQALAERTGVSPRAQRLYDALLGRDERANLLITDQLWTPAHVQEARWRYGASVFPFVDRQGRRGPAGATYIAIQLASTREAVHQTAPHGRQKKANAILVKEPARVTGDAFRAMYHGSTKAAERALRSHPGIAHYVLEGTEGAANLWGLVT